MVRAGYAVYPTLVLCCFVMFPPAILGEALRIAGNRYFYAQTIVSACTCSPPPGNSGRGATARAIAAAMKKPSRISIRKTIPRREGHLLDRGLPTAVKGACGFSEA